LGKDEEMKKVIIYFGLLMMFASTLMAATPMVEIFGPEAFVRDKGAPIVEQVFFEVPQAGPALLEIRNGSMDDVLTGEKVSSSIITLNEAEIVTPEWFNQNVEIIQIPVELLAGENSLTVELRGKVGGCITINISAPVDMIDLQPIPEPLEANVDALLCDAVVSALGVPAADIDVEFSVQGFVVTPQTAQTNSTGIASVDFGTFASVGTGTVMAVVLGSDSLLQDIEAFEVAEFQEIVLDQGLSTMIIDVGDTQYVAYTVSLIGADGQAMQVSFDQQVSPDNGGIALANDYPGGWTTSTDTTWPVNEYITGVVPGVYTITSSATILNSGQTVTKDLQVFVVNPGQEIPMMWALGCEPDAIDPNTPTDVTFSVLVTGLSLPIDVQLVQLDEFGNETPMGLLNDNGTDGDMVAGDNIYSGTVNLVSSEIGKLWFQSNAMKDGVLYTSLECAVTVTELPIGPAVSDPNSLIEDPVTGTQLYSNEIVVGFYPQVTESRIIEIVTAEGGTIIGTIPALGIYQIEIPGDGTIAGVQAVIAAFEAYPEVEYVEPSYYVETDEFAPNDTKYSSQKNMTVIRADEAWVVAKGTVRIGIVDTGVDYNHEDLTDKVIKGKDFVGNDDDPMDAGSHGTHVAGIAAASSNNSKGVAGVAWGSKIYAIRGIGGSSTVLANAMKSAADNSCKVVNVSGGIASASDALKNAVNYIDSKGALLCAAAGNDLGNTKWYPGTYEKAFCVGNTNDTDGRAGSSNYGDWVDISAPGVNVWSTIPGGYGQKTGTSMSTPLVSGAAAVVWSMHPSWTANQVRERLEKTAKPLDSSLKIGVGRIDLFEAVFNGSFEIGDLSEWSKTGTCSSLESLGALVPQHGSRMGYASTGPAGDQQAATLEKSFTVQPGVTSIPFKFEYNFVTEEYPEWVGSVFNDALNVIVTAPDGTKTTLAAETINGSTFTMYTDSPAIDFPGGDSTVGQTGWQPGSGTINVTQGAGKYTIEVKDAGDDIYDSVVLIDNIRLK
jgi:hypothetical protein